MFSNELADDEDLTDHWIVCEDCRRFSGFLYQSLQLLDSELENEIKEKKGKFTEFDYGNKSVAKGGEW